MTRFLLSKKWSFIKRLICATIAFSFVGSSLTPSPAAAQAISSFFTPPIVLSAPFTPPLVRGMTLDADNPLKFNFIVDTGDDHLQGDAFQQESMKLIKYFLVSLTVPEGDMWVNLSPTEKDRIIPQQFGQTEMGRDLLLQDYILKQLTANLMNPNEQLGKDFWQRVRQEAKEKFGTNDIPSDTLSKVWIVPDKADVYVKGQSVFVVNSHLKVMTEKEYKDVSPVTVGNQERIFKEIILPAIEREVNEGKNFAPLRQIQNSAILAAWYKKNLKQTLLGKVYVDQAKTEGIETGDKNAAERIYNQYLEAFKKGAYEFVKDEYNPETQDVVSRKYVSGGIINAQPLAVVDTMMAADQFAGRDAAMVGMELKDAGPDPDPAMTADIRNSQGQSLKDILSILQAKWPDKKMGIWNFRTKAISEISFWDYIEDMIHSEEWPHLPPTEEFSDAVTDVIREEIENFKRMISPLSNEAFRTAFEEFARSEGPSPDWKLHMTLQRLLDKMSATDMPQMLHHVITHNVIDAFYMYDSMGGERAAKGKSKALEGIRSETRYSLMMREVLKRWNADPAMTANRDLSRGELAALLTHPGMKNIFDRYPRLKPFVAAFLNRDHALKIKIFEEIDRLTDQEVLERMKTLWTLSQEKLKLHEAKEAEDVRELYLHPTQGAVDILQSIGSISGFHTAQAIDFNLDEETESRLEHVYLLFKAIRVFAEQKDAPLFQARDYEDGSRLLNYLLSSDAGARDLQNLRFIPNNLLSFSELLIETLLKEDPRQESNLVTLEKVRVKLSSPENKIIRESIHNYLSILKVLQDKSPEWKTQLTRKLEDQEIDRTRYQRYWELLEAADEAYSPDPAMTAKQIDRLLSDPQTAYSGLRQMAELIGELETASGSRVKKIMNIVAKVDHPLAEALKALADNLYERRSGNGDFNHDITFLLMIDHMEDNGPLTREENKLLLEAQKKYVGMTPTIDDAEAANIVKTIFIRLKGLVSLSSEAMSLPQTRRVLFSRLTKEEALDLTEKVKQDFNGKYQLLWDNGQPMVWQYTKGAAVTQPFFAFVVNKFGILSRIVIKPLDTSADPGANVRHWVGNQLLRSIGGPSVWVEEGKTYVYISEITGEDLPDFISGGLRRLSPDIRKRFFFALGVAMSEAQILGMGDRFKNVVINVNKLNKYTAEELVALENRAVVNIDRENVLTKRFLSLDPTADTFEAVNMMQVVGEFGLVQNLVVEHLNAFLDGFKQGYLYHQDYVKKNGNAEKMAELAGEFAPNIWQRLTMDQEQLDQLISNIRTAIEKKISGWKRTNPKLGEADPAMTGQKSHDPLHGDESDVRSGRLHRDWLLNGGGELIKQDRRMLIVFLRSLFEPIDSVIERIADPAQRIAGQGRFYETENFLPFATRFREELFKNESAEISTQIIPDQQGLNVIFQTLREIWQQNDDPQKISLDRQMVENGFTRWRDAATLYDNAKKMMAVEHPEDIYFHLMYAIALHLAGLGSHAKTPKERVLDERNQFVDNQVKDDVLMRAVGSVLDGDVAEKLSRKKFVRSDDAESQVINGLSRLEWVIARSLYPNLFPDRRVALGTIYNAVKHRSFSRDAVIDRLAVKYGSVPLSRLFLTFLTTDWQKEHFTHPWLFETPRTATQHSMNFNDRTYTVGVSGKGEIGTLSEEQEEFYLKTLIQDYYRVGGTKADLNAALKTLAEADVPTSQQLAKRLSIIRLMEDMTNRFKTWQPNAEFPEPSQQPGKSTLDDIAAVIAGSKPSAIVRVEPKGVRHDLQAALLKEAARQSGRDMIVHVFKLNEETPLYIVGKQFNAYKIMGLLTNWRRGKKNADLAFFQLMGTFLGYPKDSKESSYETLEKRLNLRDTAILAKTQDEMKNEIEEGIKPDRKDESMFSDIPQRDESILRESAFLNYPGILHGGFNPVNPLRIDFRPEGLDVKYVKAVLQAVTQTDEMLFIDNVKMGTARLLREEANGAYDGMNDEEKGRKIMSIVKTLDLSKEEQAVVLLIVYKVINTDITLRSKREIEVALGTIEKYLRGHISTFYPALGREEVMSTKEFLEWLAQAQKEDVLNKVMLRKILTQLAKTLVASRLNGSNGRPLGADTFLHQALRILSAVAAGANSSAIGSFTYPPGTHVTVFRGVANFKTASWTAVHRTRLFNFSTPIPPQTTFKITSQLADESAVNIIHSFLGIVADTAMLAGGFDLNGAEKDLPVVQKIMAALNHKTEKPFILVGGGASGKEQQLATALHYSGKTVEIFNLRNWTFRHLGNQSVREWLMEDETLSPEGRDYVSSLDEKISRLTGSEEEIRRQKLNILKQDYKTASSGIKIAESFLLHEQWEQLQIGGTFTDGVTGELNEPNTLRGLLNSSADVILFDEFDLSAGLRGFDQDEIETIRLLSEIMTEFRTKKQIAAVVHPTARADKEVMSILTESLGEEIDETKILNEIQMEFLPQEFESLALKKVGITDPEVVSYVKEKVQGLMSFYLSFLIKDGEKKVLQELQSADVPLNDQWRLANALIEREVKMIRSQKSAILDPLKENVRDTLKHLAWGGGQVLDTLTPYENALYEQLMTTLLVKSKSYTSKQKGLTRIIMPLLVQEALHDEAMLADLQSIERHYNGLVEKTNSKVELKRLYREVILRLHPDTILRSYPELVNQSHPNWTKDDYLKAGHMFNRLWEKVKTKKEEYADASKKGEEVDNFSILNNPFTDERLAALQAILARSSVRDEKVIKAVAKLLQDHDVTIRLTAAEGLMKLEATLDQLVDAYTKALGSVYTDARRFAAENLLKLADRGTTAAVPLDIATVIVESGDPSAAKKKLLERLKDYDNLDLYERVLRRLGATDEEMLDGYINAVNSSSKDAILNGLRKIGELAKGMDATRAKPALVKQLSDTFIEVIQAAETSLKIVGVTDQEMLDGYINAVNSSSKDAILNGLRKIGELAKGMDVTRAKSALLKRLSDTFIEVIQAAESSLKIVGVTDQEMLDGYINAVNSSSKDAILNGSRRIEELAKRMDATRAKSALLKRLSNTFIEVIQAAESSLRIVGVTDQEMLDGYINAINSSSKDAILNGSRKIGELAKVTDPNMAIEPLIAKLSFLYLDVVQAADSSLKKIGVRNKDLIRGYTDALKSIHSDIKDYAKKRLSELNTDTALTAEKGGIDLNPNQNILQEHGETMKPARTDPAKWENYRTNGFVPVIIHITPPQSLPLILGAIENASSGELSLSSLN
jgi:hypothetical protein